MRDLLGAEAEALVDALDRPRAPAVRLNPLRGDTAELAKLLPWTASPVPWSASGRFVASPSAEVAAHPLNDAGVYYQQDPASMAVAESLAPRPGELVVDVAAAPGGKATHAAGLAEDDGLLVANEIAEGRARSLLGNVERLGVTSAVVTNSSVGRLRSALAERADGVILDAPCSGEGTFRRSDAARESWSEAGTFRNAELQRTLLSQAADIVRPGGRLVYSTCTFDTRENEEVVNWFLARRDDFIIEPLELAGTADAGRFGLPGAVRLWPHLGHGDGHFVARLVRTGSTRATLRTPPPTASRLTRERTGATHAPSAGALAAWREFASDHLRGVYRDPGRIELYGRRLLALPDRFEAMPGVHVLRAGLHLGDIAESRGGTRFEPAHALAMAAGPDWIGPSIELSGDAEALTEFFAGAPMAAPQADGLSLVTYRGFALGLARAGGGGARSLLPKGLRRSR